jgi:hypothetical protein
MRQNARFERQGMAIADDAAISKLMEKRRPGAVLDAMANQRRQREAVAAAQTESDLLVAPRTGRATPEAQRQHVERGPIQYIATMAGVDVERAVRWLILLMVLTCDPLAITLMVAAASGD